MTPDIKVFEAAHKIQSAEMQPFFEWLKSSRTEVMELLSTAKPEVVQILQGEAQRLKRVIDLIESSRDVLEKRRS